MNNNKLPVSEELDFICLLELLPALHNVPQFAWLPELFSIIGHERLLKLCKYAGGETIRIPTLDELTSSIDALQWYYDVHIKKTKNSEDVPMELLNSYLTICEIYDASDDKE